jgi:hypothetical protein
VLHSPVLHTIWPRTTAAAAAAAAAVAAVKAATTTRLNLLPRLCFSTYQVCFPKFTHLKILEKSKYTNIHIQQLFINNVSATCHALPFQFILYTLS